MQPRNPIQIALDAAFSWAAWLVYKPLALAESLWLRLTHTCTQHTSVNDDGDIECRVCGRDLTN